MPSLCCWDSYLTHDDVGRFFFDFEAPRRRDGQRRGDDEVRHQEGFGGLPEGPGVLRQVLWEQRTYYEVDVYIWRGAVLAVVLYRCGFIATRGEIAKDPKKWQFPDVEFGTDLATEHERWLAEVHAGGRCVFVYDYPRSIKSFYMRDNEDGKTVAAMDVLVPGIGEIIGGSQREERLDVLKKKCADFNIPEEHVWWYLETRKFGTAPHCGFGMGFERLVMYVTGMGNIRDVIPFPRTPQNAEF